MLSVPQIINIAKASLYLASVDVLKGNLYSPRLIPESSKMIYMELQAVEWMYNLDPNNSSLIETTNYLYSLCRGYNLQAKNIVCAPSTLAVFSQTQGGGIYDVSLSGIPQAGDVVDIVMGYGILPGPISTYITYTYTAVAGDTAVSIMNNLVSIINLYNAPAQPYLASYNPGIHPYIQVTDNILPVGAYTAGSTIVTNVTC